MAEINSEAAAATQRELRGVLPAGSRLRSYELISVLGRGAFGITYRALDTTLHRDVAIKEYLPTSLALREDGTMVMPLSTELAEEFVWGRERFLEEARTLVQLDDVPAVVRVIDFLEDNGTAYMVMALARGETLAQRLRRDGPLPSPAIERMLYPLLDGLEQVHEVGFLHRDIKPANVILDARGNPTLIDFGAARAAMAGRSTAMTAIFTPGYAAVEQFTSAAQGPWTDIYGLSATLYHAITGEPPPSAIDRMLADTCVPLGTLLPVGFEAGLLAGIDAGLAVRVGERPDSIAAWRPLFMPGAADRSADAATQLVGKPRAPSSVAVAAASAGGPAANRPGRRVLWSALAAVAIVLLGVGYLLFGFDRLPFTGKVVQSLTADELEQALAERRKADAAAGEKKRLEEEAQRQADLDAKAKEGADAELSKARDQRQKAEAELAKLKSDMEARRQAEATQREQAVAAARQALQEAEQRNKAETELAALRKADEEAKQQAVAAAAAQQQADEDAQRKAEAEAAALRQAEEEARKKAVAEAEAKQQADEALAKAQAERKRADEEAARQKAEMEVRQRADVDARAKADADARAKADAAAKQKADAEAKAKADADVAAEKKAAETAEGALRLTTIDRQRLQVALTSLGFDTRGTDGAFGPRSREMIAGWQKARNQPQTGFLIDAQRKALLREAAASVSNYDDEQKKIEDEKKKAEEEVKKKADDAKAAAAASGTPATPTQVVPAPAAALTGGEYSGTYSGTISMQGGVGLALNSVWQVTLQATNVSGAATMNIARCGSYSFSIKISPAGEISGGGDGINDVSCAKAAISVRGRAANGQMQLTVTGLSVNGVGTLRRQGN